MAVGGFVSRPQRYLYHLGPRYTQNLRLKAGTAIYLSHYLKRYYINSDYYSETVTSRCHRESYEPA